MTDFTDTTGTDNGLDTTSNVDQTTNDSQDIQPIELNDDSYIKVPGVDKPVRYKEHFGGLQSQFTKTAQEKARLQGEYEKAQALLQERDRRLKDLESRFSGGQPPQQKNPLEELSGKLKALPYLKGEEAAEVVSQVLGGFGQVSKALQDRDKVLGLMYQRIQQLEQGVNSYTGQRAEQEFEGKIAGFVKQLGLPEKAQGFAKKLYLAYEGDDLDAEFPNILKQEWDDLNALLDEQRRARIEAARKAPFVPGRGGNGRPSKPLAAQLANATPAQTADALWDMVRAGDGD